MNNKEKIDIAIKSIRELKERYPDSSSSQLARKMGLAQSTFSRIEKGTTTPSIESLSKILASVNRGFLLMNFLQDENPILANILKQDFRESLRNSV